VLTESRFVGRRDDFGPALRALVELGRSGEGEQRRAADSADPIDKLRRRRVFEHEVARARLECVIDALV
jgi:hypothetical protein